MLVAVGRCCAHILDQFFLVEKGRKVVQISQLGLVFVLTDCVCGPPCSGVPSHVHNIHNTVHVLCPNCRNMDLSFSYL